MIDDNLKPYQTTDIDRKNSEMKHKILNIRSMISQCLENIPMTNKIRSPFSLFRHSAENTQHSAQRSISYRVKSALPTKSQARVPAKLGDNK